MLAAAAEPPGPIWLPAAVHDLADCQRGVRQLIGLEGGEVLIFAATGTIALEAAAASIIEPGAHVTVVVTGAWGDRWASICRRLGATVDVVEPPPGHPADPTKVRRVAAEHRSAAVLVTDVDSSTGVHANLEELHHAVRDLPALLCVDGICAAGAERVAQSAWNVDVYITSTPKAIGVPAGLAIIALADRAAVQLTGRRWQPATYALDLVQWLPSMRAAELHEFAYFQSPSGNLLHALREGLRLIMDEGVDARIRRHAQLRHLLYDGLQSLGISTITASGAEANGVTVARLPDRPAFIAALAEAGLIVAAGTHKALAPVTFRIGHLGWVTGEDIDEALGVIDEVLCSRDARSMVLT